MKLNAYNTSILAAGLMVATWAVGAENETQADTSLCLSPVSLFVVSDAIANCSALLETVKDEKLRDRILLAKGRHELNAGRLEEGRETSAKITNDTAEALLLKSDVALMMKDYDAAATRATEASEKIKTDAIRTFLHSYAYGLQFQKLKDQTKSAGPDTVYETVQELLDTDASAHLKHQVLALAGRYAFVSQKDAKSALAYFDRAISEFPEFPEAYNNRANLRNQSGNLAGALEDYDQAYKLQNKSPSSKLNLRDYTKLLELEGLARLRLGDQFGAAQTFKKFLEVAHKPRLQAVHDYFIDRISNLLKTQNLELANREANIGRSLYTELELPILRAAFELDNGVLFMKNGHPEKTKELLTAAEPVVVAQASGEEYSPNTSTLLLKIAALHLGLNQREASQKAIELAKNLPMDAEQEANVATNIGDLWVMYAQQDDGAFEMARQEYARAVQLTPKYENYRNIWLERLQKEVEATIGVGQPDVALALINDAERLFLLTDGLLILRANILQNTDTASAKKDFENAYRTASSKETRLESLMGLGRLALATGDLDAAKTYFHEASVTDINSVEAWRNRAEVARKLGQKSEQIQALQQLLLSHPNDMQARFQMGQGLQESDRNSEAYSEFTIVLNNTAPDSEIHNLALLHRAIGSFSLDQMDNAKQDLDAITGPTQDNSLVKLWLARIAIRQRNSDVAVSLMKEALPEMEKGVVKKYQEILTERGFDLGTPDGVFGPATMRAIADCAKIKCI